MRNTFKRLSIQNYQDKHSVPRSEQLASDGHVEKSGF